MRDRQHLRKRLEAERLLFVQSHPKSRELFESARDCLLGGVPMSWMMKWAGGFPVFVKEAHGATLVDVDGHSYTDLCLGDTGAMAGHSPMEVTRYVVEQTSRGITTMLPTEDAIWVGKELRARFGLRYWQFALTATDANRFVIRLAREITQRPKILVFNRCYHGSVDETLITLVNGIAGPRKGNVGPPVDPSVTSKVVEFNDIPALEEALAPQDVACVLAEPAMTNIGIILPDPAFHEALRDFTRRTGTLLILDETHTICAGPSGYTGLHQLQPDMLTIGKAIGSGIPSAAYGVSEEVAERISSRTEADFVDAGGIGGTLAGNALSIAAMRATLEHVLNATAFDRMLPLGKSFSRAVEDVIQHYELPWHVSTLGCRAEYRFRSQPPRNGTEAVRSIDEDLDAYMHLFAINRGVLLTPFHNMALMSPQTTQHDIDHHTDVFRASVESLR
jgi:glutamate-1-semialdehyde 2,1-aminomutase